MSDADTPTDESIVVTGAAGTVGQHVVRELGEAGATVRAGVHSPENAAHLDSENVDVVGIDFTKPSTLTEAFDGATTVFLLTPFVPNQAELVEPAVEAAEQTGIEHVVRLSAIGAEADEPLTLAGWHREAESLIEQSDLAYTHVRPATFMQNYLGYADSIRSDDAFYDDLGEAPANFVDARDVAAVAAAVLTGEGHAGEAYTVTGPELISPPEIADVFTDVLGREISYVEVSPEAVRENLEADGWPETLVDGLLDLHASTSADEQQRLTSTVEDLTGRQPRTFEQFARDHADAFQ